MLWGKVTWSSSLEVLTLLYNFENKIVFRPFPILLLGNFLLLVYKVTPEEEYEAAVSCHTFCQHFLRHSIRSVVSRMMTEASRQVILGHLMDKTHSYKKNQSLRLSFPFVFHHHHHPQLKKRYWPF